MSRLGIFECRGLNTNFTSGAVLIAGMRSCEPRPARKTAEARPSQVLGEYFVNDPAYVGKCFVARRT
jgi:hypothetical protein